MASSDPISFLFHLNETFICIKIVLTLLQMAVSFNGRVISQSQGFSHHPQHSRDLACKLLVLLPPGPCLLRARHPQLTSRY